MQSSPLDPCGSPLSRLFTGTAAAHPATRWRHTLTLPLLHPTQSPERREGAQQPLPQEHLCRQPGQPHHTPPQRQPHPPTGAVGHRPSNGHRALHGRPGEPHRHGEERAPGGSLSSWRSFSSSINQSVRQSKCICEALSCKKSTTKWRKT